MGASFPTALRPADDDRPPLLAVDTRTAAEMTGLSKTWLEQLRVKGLGPSWLKVGKRVVYRVTDLESWLAQHEHPRRAA